MFGITLWELLTREIPFGNYKNLFDVYEAVLRGERPDIPEFTPAPYQSILTSCWKTDPQERMSMEDIMELITNYSATIGCAQIELAQMNELHHKIEIIYDNTLVNK